MKMYLSAAVTLCAAVILQTQAESTEFEKVVSGNNQFSNKLYKEISDGNNGNVFMSGYSVHTLLSLLYQGSEKASENALRGVIGASGKEQTAKGYKQLSDSLKRVKGITLNSANKIYVKEGFQMKDDFSQNARNNFGADAQQINFVKSTQAASTINKWVSDNTNDKIKNLIDPKSLDASTALVLVNAIYFKGLWLQKFNKEHTKKAPFYLPNGRPKQVDQMFVLGEFKYKHSKELGAKIIDLPYVGGEVSMIVVLPDNNTGLGEVEKKISNSKIEAFLDDMYLSEVEVYMPKFKIETKMDLKRPLINMGLENIFTPQANFSGIANEPLYVSEAVQKAFIEVNEEGTEAAAATGGGLALSIRPRPQQMKMDHPYLIYIVSKIFTERSERMPLFVQSYKPNVLFSGRVARIK